VLRVACVFSAISDSSPETGNSMILIMMTASQVTSLHKYRLKSQMASHKVNMGVNKENKRNKHERREDKIKQLQLAL
jgi:hypothetical protein